MKHKGIAAVVIPVYKEIPTGDEVRSLNQCLAVLKNYPAIIIHPITFNASHYENLIRSYPNVSFKAYQDIYFESITGYNQLLMSVFFYQDYQDYQFILIYQLDCYVFRDELLDWCNKGYDYIGAPWIGKNIFKSWLCSTDLYPKSFVLLHRILFRGKFLSLVGNGGFSLRRVDGMIRNLIIFKKSARSWRANEDSYYSHYIKLFNPFFKIPAVGEALKFSFDVNPDVALRLNGNNLPFGCHGWCRNDAPHYKQNVLFWEPHIKP